MNPMDLLTRAGATSEDAVAYAEHIRILGDPVLRTAARPVSVFDGELYQLIITMTRVLLAAGGVGLAAPQLGRPSRALIYRMANADDQPLMALINPSWTALTDETETAVEGCLSLPGLPVGVRRHTSIHVQASSVTGEPFSFDTHGMEARVIQHEIDHLDGTLIVDRVSARERYEALMRFAHIAPPVRSIIAPPNTQTGRAPAKLSEQMRQLRQAAAQPDA